jgi:hypothetical protein
MYESLLWVGVERMASEAESLALLQVVTIEKLRHLVMPVECYLFPDHERVVCDVSEVGGSDSTVHVRLK